MHRNLCSRGWKSVRGIGDAKEKNSVALKRFNRGREVKMPRLAACDDNADRYTSVTPQHLLPSGCTELDLEFVIA